MIQPTTQAFVKELEEGLRQPDRWLPGHPLVGKLERGELTRSQIAGLMAQVYRQTVEVVRWLGYLYAKCPVMEVRREIFNNLVEEELGSFSNTEGHFHLAARVAVAAGADRKALDSTPLLRATRALVKFGEHCFYSDPRWIVGFGAAFGFEYQSPMAFDAIAKALKKSYGMSSEDVAFFEVHVTADEDHTSSIVRVFDTYATSDEDRQAVREAAWKYGALYMGMLSTYESFS
jgi:pyrroloquinoline quinone (PQQ) biosynthesis protein C